MDPIMLLLRMVVPLSIFRYPLVGGLISMWLDAADWRTNFFHLTNLHPYYDQLDKLLDIFYLTIEAYTVFSWKKGLAKSTALGLYMWRTFGVALFELTKLPIFLVVFPNAFEGFFLLYWITRVIQKGEPRFTRWMIVFTLLLLAIPKIIQEWAMHIAAPRNWRFVHMDIFHMKFEYDTIGYQIGIAIVLIVCLNIFLYRKGVKYIWRQ